MPRQAILLVHGMGKHSAPADQPPGSFGKQFINTITESLQAYPKHSSDFLENYVDIHEFNYDEWFDEIRKTLADRAKSMGQRLNTVSMKYNVSFAADLVGKLISFEEDFGSDEFFYTHWLDVVFYTTVMGAEVRTELGMTVSKLVEDYGQGNVHCIAHSLGTAVLHDTLHLLFRDDHDPNDKIPDLDPNNHRLATIWMFANVSRLVNSVTGLVDTLKSIVKPGVNGCCNAFYNVRHKLDPFTWIATFNPKNDGSWVDETTYIRDYKNIVNELVVDVNTHSVVQYLQDPQVAENLLYRFVRPFNVTLEEFDKAKANYAKKSINGAHAFLENAFRNLSRSDVATWRDFFVSAKALEDASKNKSGFLA